MSERGVISVGQLNQYVKSLLESDRILKGLMVRGEISNFTRHYKSGHLYFTLKDDTASIKSVMFRGQASALRFAPENGMSVIVSGSVSLYERDGSYQFYVTDMQPDGIGALHLAFEQLKQKLANEGLFDAERKRPLPAYPERIGVVTSEGAAALQDIRNILSRRFPAATMVLCPAQVQGEGADKTIIAALERLWRDGNCDVIIVGRGGGSIEDLWAFNSEALARAIARSPVPIVSAVGHETDFTIADFAADLRAPTPSAAAELVTPDIRDLQYTLDRQSERLLGTLTGRLDRLGRRLETAKSRLKTPAAVLERYGERLVLLQKLAQGNIQRKIDVQQAKLQLLAAQADGRSPTKILARGYSLTLDMWDRAVVSIAQVKTGDRIRTRVADGEVFAVVEQVKEQTK